MLEADDTHQAVVKDFQSFEKTICELLYTLHTKKDPKSEVEKKEI
jgi:hypothetical protein